MIIFFSRVADPEGVDPDPDPTTKKNWIQIRPSRKKLIQIRPDFDRIKIIDEKVNEMGYRALAWTDCGSGWSCPRSDLQ